MAAMSSNRAISAMEQVLKSPSNFKKRFRRILIRLGYLGVSIGSLEGSPLGVRDGPSPLGSSGFDLALPGAELGAGEDTVSVGIVGVDDDSGVGGGEGADSNLELVEVEGAGVVPVEDAPVLGAEVVEEVLASLAHLDEAGDLGSAAGELVRVDDTIDTAAEGEEGRVGGVTDRVDGSRELCGVGRGVVVDFDGLVPPVLGDPGGGRGTDGGNESCELHFYRLEKIKLALRDFIKKNCHSLSKLSYLLRDF